MSFIASIIDSLSKLSGVLPVFCAVLSCLFSPNLLAETKPINGYILSPLPEAAAARAVRHQRIADRRQGPIVMVHRGAFAFAPENTLEAYAAAMDYGADGCEVDIRRTADGVLVMFHDDGLERMTDAIGPIHQHTYSEVVALRFRSFYGARPGTGLPTLAAVLELARQRAMLLHLDIKEPGLEEDIAKLLDAADVWDHVVEVNEANASELRKNPKLQRLAYKASGLQGGRLDMDPAKVKEALARPGKMILVDDPRVAARELNRPPHRIRLPDSFRAPWPTNLPAIRRDTHSFSPPHFLRALSKRVDGRSLDELEKLLTADFTERTDLEGDVAYQQKRATRIVERAWAAEKIGRLGTKSSRAVQLLEQQVVNRSLHRDWAWHGLDGAMAARALGALRATESVPVLVRAFFAIDPELKKMIQPPANYPYVWTDFRPKLEMVVTLGDLPCEQSKAFLLDYLAMDENAAGKFSAPLFEEATKALLRQDLTRDELKSLLQSRHSAVRGTAILECLDHPTDSRAAMLKAAQPWALDLPTALSQARSGRSWHSPSPRAGPR